LSASLTAGDAKTGVIYEIANNTCSEFAVIEYNKLQTFTNSLRMDAMKKGLQPK
jgi:hypothetical protein